MSHPLLGDVIHSEEVGGEHCKGCGRACGLGWALPVDEDGAPPAKASN